MKLRSDRILVRGPDTVGSFVLASPFIRELRKNLPNSYIVLSIKPLVYELAKNCPYADKIILYEENKVKNILKFRQEKFDTVFLLSGSFESALVSLLAGIKNRIGYPHDHRGFLLTTKIIEKKRTHYVDYILHILETMGYKVEDRTPQLFLEIIKELSPYDFFFSGNRPVVGITYASIADDARKWPKEYTIELTNMLVDKGYNVVLLGKTNYEFEVATSSYVLNLVNKTTLTEFVSIVKKLHTYISVATGGIHIAAALGVRVVGLFVPGDEIGWSPYSNKAIVISKKVDCSPCNPHKMKRCKDNICMKKITPSELISFF